MDWIRRWLVIGAVAYAFGVAGWFLSRGMSRANDTEIVLAMVVVTVVFVGPSVGALVYLLAAPRPGRSKTANPDDARRDSVL
jgi:hypothetical protein